MVVWVEDLRCEVSVLGSLVSEILELASLESGVGSPYLIASFL